MINKTSPGADFNVYFKYELSWTIDGCRYLKQCSLTNIFALLVYVNHTGFFTQPVLESPTVRARINQRHILPSLRPTPPYYKHPGPSYFPEATLSCQYPFWCSFVCILQTGMHLGNGKHINSMSVMRTTLEATQ